MSVNSHCRARAGVTNATSNADRVELARNQQRGMAVPQRMKADRWELPRLHKDRPIAAQIVGRHRLEVRRREHQRAVVRLAQAEPHPHFELADTVRLERLDRERRQRDVTTTAPRLGLLEGQSCACLLKRSLDRHRAAYEIDRTPTE